MNSEIDKNIEKMKDNFQECLDTLQYITKGCTKDLEVKKYKYICNRYAENIESLNVFLQNLDVIALNFLNCKISINITDENNAVDTINENILDSDFINDLIAILTKLKERQYLIHSDLFEKYKRLKNNTH
jgi:hypothetical protein